MRATASPDLAIGPAGKPWTALLRKVYKIEIVCSTRRDILIELKIDQDVQGQRGSYHQHQLGFPHHLGVPGKYFGENFIK